MLKGQVFKEQIFENQIFAVFINTFLNGKNGIIDGYKNSMAVSAGNNSVTVQSGVICIQGRFLEEDTYTTLPVTTETAYCSLVVEINLDNINTDIDFTQGYYKILKNANNYPVLTQDDIVNTNSGIYQYELARFKTSLNGISDFIDLRSYIDYESLYKEIETKLNEIEDGSIYVLKKEFNELKERVEKEHPISSLYLSMSSINPSEYYGGTWQLIAQGRMLVGVNPNDSDFSDSNKIGGSKQHTLTIDEMPSHTHEQNPHKHTTDASAEWNVGATARLKIEESNTTRSTSVDSTTATNKNTGGDKPFSIMPPYITCYIWQRTA